MKLVAMGSLGLKSAKTSLAAAQTPRYNLVGINRGFKMKKITGRAGFTVIEMLVVVAILGVVATMAAVNSSRTSSKSKQSQIKALLAGIYSSEKVFYAEYNTYTPYMSDLNFFSTSGFYELYYEVGFLPIGPNPTDSQDVTWANGVDVTLRDSASITLSNYCVAPKCRYVQAGGVALPTVNATLCADCTSRRTTFKIVGSGFLHFPTTDDRWTMDHTKTLTHVQEGAM